VANEQPAIDCRSSSSVSYTHILLDLDHTLLDTETSLRLAFDDAMHAVGADPLGQYDTFDEINAALWKQVEAHALTPDQVHQRRFEQLNDVLELEVDPSTMADAFAIGMGARGDLYPGALDALKALAATATLAMITNGLSGIQRARIERLELNQFFDAITISAEAGCSKPGTEIFDITFEVLGQPDRSRALMVGDSLSSDIAGGHNAGVDTCWYNPGGALVGDKQPATFEIQALSELPALATGAGTPAT